MKFLPAALLAAVLAVPAAAEDIQLAPVSIGEAHASYPTEVADANRAAAAKAGVNLDGDSYRYSSRGYKDGQAFLLFFTKAQALTCNREYLVQRVRLIKDFQKKGQAEERTEEYLVEVIKLDDDKVTKRADEHRKRYALGDNVRRKLTAEYEIGCGEIIGTAAGAAWPFEPNKLYRRVQDYQSTPGLYDTVRFDFSRRYTLEMSFDDAGNYWVRLPDFIPE